ncbi:unnamed protein product [Linum tenue]|uniref:Uncharacterized protein n=1 Tax=Linum tenue TaxID=586396 RepID=A0AAV0GTM7_9ROSI|nr:unnamed protein product [Linum tenue]
MANTILLLSLATILLATASEASPPELKSGSFYSPPFEMTPGKVVFDYFYGVDFPTGHLAVKTFRADLVDDDDNVIPFHEVYLHHSSMSRYYQAQNYSIPSVLETETLPYSETGGFVYRRNDGICQSDILGQYLGLGTEMQSTPYVVPDPYGMEVGDPAQIPAGRDLYNVSVDGLGRELDQFGEPLPDDYYGGLSCCYAHTRCKVKEGFHAPSRMIRLRYSMTWTEWEPSIVPVRVYIFDITDEMKLKVSRDTGAVTAEHDCGLEYMVESCHVNGPKNNIIAAAEDDDDDKRCADFQKTIVPMPNGGDVIFGLTHLHGGAINSTIYGQDGRVLCKTEPIYGEGEEEGYIVGISTCQPEPGSVWINDGEMIVHETVYTAARRRTGVMGLFYLLVADRREDALTPPATNSFLRLPSLLAEKVTVGPGVTATSTSGAVVGVGLLLVAAVVLVVVVGKRTKTGGGCTWV